MAARPWPTPAVEIDALLPAHILLLFIGLKEARLDHSVQTIYVIRDASHTPGRAALLNLWEDGTLEAGRAISLGVVVLLVSKL